MSGRSKNKNRKLVKLSLREECRKRLVEMVIKGHYGQGERLNETKIAEELGVSQTPVREALVALECQGFLISYPNRGFVVKPFSRKEGYDLYHTIADLEAIALEQAVWPNLEILEQAEKLNQKFKATQDPEERIEFDIEWHDLLISQTDNQYLRELIELTKKMVFRYEWNYMSGDVEKSFQHHKGIIYHLKRGCIDEAVSLLRENHLLGIPILDEWLGKKDESSDLGRSNA